MASHTRFSNDSSLLAYLLPAGGANELIVMSPVTGLQATLLTASTVATHGKPKTTRAELLRERRRAPAAGIAGFSWVPDSDEMVVPLGQAVLLVQAGLALAGVAADNVNIITPVMEVPRLAAPVMFPGEHGASCVPIAAEAEPIDAKPSPCGRFTGFVLDDELCICRSDGTGPVVQVTSGARGVDGLSNATADYCSAEDLDRYTAWWWGPDSTKLLVQHTDERKVPLLRIARLGDDDDGFNASETHRYPLPGGNTPLIHMSVVSIGDVLAALDPPEDAPAAASRSLPICLGEPGAVIEGTEEEPGSEDEVADVLVPDAGFCPDGSVYVQVLSRDFTQLDLVRFCAVTGRAELLVRESNPSSWVNPDHLLTWLPLEQPSSPPTQPPPLPATGIGSLGASTLSGAASPASAASPGIRRGSSARRFDLASPTAQGSPSPSTGTARASATARVRQQMLFVWASERSGFRHLLLYAVGMQFSFDADLTIAKARAAADGTNPASIGMPDEKGIPTGPGDPRRVVLVPGAEPEATLRRPVTGGDWLVINDSEGTGNGSGLAVHAASKSILFTANAASPLEMHVYRAPLLTQRASAASSRGLTATAPHHAPLAISQQPPTVMTGAGAQPSPYAASSPLAPASPSSRASSSRSLRPRIPLLLGAGSAGADLASWGLTLGTYNISQVTPGTRGRCGIIASPDGAFAIMTRSSLAEHNGATATDLVSLDTLADSSGSAVTSSVHAATVSGSRPMDPRAGLSFGQAGRAVAADVTAVMSPHADVGGVEEFDATASIRATRFGRVIPPSALPADADFEPKPPPLTFDCPNPSPASTIGFPREESIISPSGFCVSRLCRLSGPDLGPIEAPQPSPPSSAAPTASAAPASLAVAPPLAPSSLLDAPGLASSRDSASEPMRTDLSRALGMDSGITSVSGAGSVSDSSSPTSSNAMLVQGSASPQSSSGTLDTMGISRTAQDIIAVITAPVTSAMSPRSTTGANKGLGVVAAAAAAAAAAGSAGSAADAVDESAVVSPAKPLGPADGVIFFACPAADGITTLFGVIQLPQPAEGVAASSAAGSGPSPAVLRVYGGPHVQMVRDDQRALGGGAVQALRKQGMAVFSVDNRGSWDRGRRFEAAIGGRMGLTDVADQFAATRFLIDKGFIDPRRLGVTGWSYGGFMTLMLLAKSAPAKAEGLSESGSHSPHGISPAAAAVFAPASPGPALRRSESGSGLLSTPPVCFRVGVAGGSVTDWRMYESSYTEHYMGFPQENEEAYARGSVLEFVEGLRNKKLMLVHGLLDENVLVRHTTRLMSRMVKAGIPFESLLLPDCRHGPRTAGEGMAVMERSLEHFKRHLLA